MTPQVPDALVTVDGVRFRDLDHDGVMAPYEDPRRTPEERVADLLPRLSLEEKAGLLFHTILGVSAPGDHDTRAGIGTLSARDSVIGRSLNHFNVHALPAPKETARWQNALQALAATTPHGIPVTISSDPRHAFAENSGVAFAASGVSQWPEPLGLAALGDEGVVRAFADTVRREYRALGIRAALHPQVDLATEPRWGRQAQTFGQDAATTSRLLVAFLEGLQGADLADGVAATTKHFPGGGPQADGEDPHFPYGREQVYPGGRFAEHLEPFRAAIAAGTAAIMPYYGMPIGLELGGDPVEPVAFAFNRRIITGLLREELGYDGVVLSDWGLITDVEIMGKPFPARAWGVEHLPPAERLAAILDAGCDQLGGEDRTDLLLGLVAAGRITEARLDASAARLLLVKFRLGLFDDPFVDEEEAERVVGAAPFREAGRRAQARSVVVLRGGPLPLASGTRVHAEGVDPSALVDAGLVPSGPESAEVVLVRLAAPFEPRDRYFLEAMFHQGSLDLAPETVAAVRATAERLPTIVDVALDRPAVLTSIADAVAGLTASFGTSDAALLDALTGRIAPEGRLPFELPRSMAAVAASRPDVPSDTADPLFPSGFGG